MKFLMEMFVRLRIWFGLSVDQLDAHVLKLKRVCLRVSEAVFLLIGELPKLGGRDEIGDCPLPGRSWPW